MLFGLSHLYVDENRIIIIILFAAFWEIYGNFKAKTKMEDEGILREENGHLHVFCYSTLSK